MTATRQQPAFPNFIDQGALSLASQANPSPFHYVLPSHDAATKRILEHEMLNIAFTRDSSALDNTLQSLHLHGVSLQAEHGGPGMSVSEMFSCPIAGSCRVDLLALTDTAVREQTMSSFEKVEKVEKVEKARIPEAEWEAKKDIIIELYWNKQYTMRQLRDAMRTIHGFGAS